jgi:hypothetical protein
LKTPPLLLMNSRGVKEIFSVEARSIFLSKIGTNEVKFMANVWRI